MTFTLLGPLEIRRNGVDHAPTAPKVLQLTGLLLMHPGRVVRTDAIIEELWDGRPPPSVRSTMQTYVYHLRRCIERQALASGTGPEPMLATRPPGYLLRISSAQVDVFGFRRRCDDGRALLRAGRNADAALAFRSALEQWSGPPLANVSCGPVLSAFVVDLQEQRRNARHLRIEAEIACGAHRELIGELRSMTATERLDEGAHAQLMRVLARSGRRSEAMATYRDLHSRLTRELGVGPCEELQNLHRHLLSDPGERPGPS